jgi:hypothetical protein
VTYFVQQLLRVGRVNGNDAGQNFKFAPAGRGRRIRFARNYQVAFGSPGRWPFLDGLAGQELEFDCLTRQQGYAVDKMDVIRWWLKASQGSEEAYLVDHFFDSDEFHDESEARESDAIA